MRILILPWFNSNMKNINKYIHLYKNLGVDKVDVINYPLNKILSNKGWLELRETNKNITKNYDVVHNFSGGSLLYYNLCKIGLDNKKVIYDSGPMFPTPECTSNYIVNFYNLNQNYKPIFNSVIDFYWNIELKTLDNKQLEKLIYYKNNYKDYNNVIFNKDKETLILNDLNDKIVLHEEINKNLKNNIETYYFKNSTHVKHLRYHENEYQNIIKNFI